MRFIDEIIIHCTDTRPETDVTYDMLYEWHVLDKKWKHIGYHYLIDRDGDVITCRSLNVPGAHTKSRNQNTIGIVLAGGATGFDFNIKQIKALDDLVVNLWSTFTTITKVSGHRDYSEKTCPNFDAGILFEGTLIR